MSGVLGSVGGDCFANLHLMSQPIEPDKMKVEDNYDIYEIRIKARAKKDKINQAIRKPDAICQLPQIKAKRSFQRSTSVAKSTLKDDEPVKNLRIRKNNQVHNILSR